MYVLVIVTLRDTRTNEVVRYEDKAQYGSVDEAVTFWTEGECGCDCNRGFAIWKAKQGKTIAPHVQLPCRRTKHVIELVQIEALVVVEPSAAPPAAPIVA